MGGKINKKLTRKQIKILEDKHPLGFGGYVDVLNSVKFLIDGNSKWITGTNLVIDGGYLL